MIPLTVREDGIVIAVKAQPGARKDTVLGERAGALRVAVSAAPEKGKANDAVQAVLARALGCRPSQIGLLSGATSRDKSFLVSGVPLVELKNRVESLLRLSEPGPHSQD